jgi:signal transduction histidine kinase
MRSPALDRAWRPPIVQFVAGVGGTALLVAAAVVRGDSAADVAVAVVLSASGLLLWRSGPPARRPGWLLILTGWTWLAGAVLHRGPLGHLLLTWPTGRTRSRWVTTAVAFCYADGLLESVLATDLLSVAFGTVLAGTAIARLMTSSGLTRRGRLIGSLAGVAVGGLIIAARLLVAVRPEAIAAASGMYDTFVLLTAVGLVLDFRFGGWTKGAATTVVLALGGGGNAQSLQGRLARVLGDPLLTVALPAGDGYVDEQGRSTDPHAVQAGRAALQIRDGREVLAYVVHDATLGEDPALLDAIATATRIAVDNGRLRNAVEASAAAIVASQGRLLSAADDQRRRMERLVAQGPLARIEAARLVADTALRGRARHLGVDVEEQLDMAARELQLFALGLYPDVLSSQGVAAAVTALAAATPMTVSVDISLERLPEPVEVCVYFFCAEAIANAVKHANATRVAVEGSIRVGAVHMAITDDGEGGADPGGAGLRGLADRVTILGGRMTVVSPPGRGTRAEAILPIAPVPYRSVISAPRA